MDQDTKRNLPRIFFFLAAVLLLVKVYRDREAGLELQNASGFTMGSIAYNIKYRTDQEFDMKFSVDSILTLFNQSLSTYDPTSEISTFNDLDTLVFDDTYFLPILQSSKEVNKMTNGAFDPTIGIIVNEWGFGPSPGREPSPEKIDSLLEFVGYDKINFNSHFAYKKSGVSIDFSAIAKGYAIDEVARFIDSRGIKNYMVEIGGEVRASGNNDKGKAWAIGIENPLSGRESKEMMAIIELQNRAVATSGNYRNYFEKDGKVFAHIIDPRTGFTATHNLLSASVIMTSCMMADAYATAFMVLGVEKSLELAQSIEDLDVILIYREGDEIKKYVTEGIRDQVRIL